jgi:uncharacterized membrane protein YgcG
MQPFFENIVSIFQNMTPLRPTHYLYLKNPLFSNGVEMLKTTLQELCLVGALKLDTRWEQIDRRYNREMRRSYFIHGPNFKTYQTSSEAENFLLNPFFEYPELGFAHLKHYLRNRFGRNIHEFKNKYVRQDVNNHGYLNFKYFLSSTGRRSKSEMKKRISYINTHINYLLRDLEKLKIELTAVGLGIILLDRDVLEKLKAVDKSILDLSLLKLISDTDDPYYYSSFIGFAALDSFDSFDSFDSVDFGGFDGGGGDSGGGGADGDW